MLFLCIKSCCCWNLALSQEKSHRPYEKWRTVLVRSCKDPMHFREILTWIFVLRKLEMVLTSNKPQRNTWINKLIIIFEDMNIFDMFHELNIPFTLQTWLCRRKAQFSRASSYTRVNDTSERCFCWCLWLVGCTYLCLEDTPWQASVVERYHCRSNAKGNKNKKRRRRVAVYWRKQPSKRRNGKTSARGLQREGVVTRGDPMTTGRQTPFKECLLPLLPKAIAGGVIPELPRGREINGQVTLLDN